MSLRVAAVALAALLVACGGGGSSPTASGTIVPAPALRTDLLFGYYGGVSANVLEVAPHANIYFASLFEGPLGQMAALTHAKGAGLKAIVQLPAWTPAGPTPEPELRFWLQRLKDAGLLDHVVAVYPIDEPDTPRQGNLSDDQVTTQLAVVRRAMAAVELTAKVAIVYACDSGRTPGFAAADWIGCDKYPDGCAVLARYVEPLRSRLTPSQRLIVLPGGADPWRQDPACFESYAHGHSEVALVMPFIWQTVQDGETFVGIRENPTRPLYEAAGRKIKQ